MRTQPITPAWTGWVDAIESLSDSEVNPHGLGAAALLIFSRWARCRSDR